MRKFVFVVAFVSLPFTARAADSGGQFAVRGGFSLPVGGLAGSLGTTHPFHGFTPIGLEAGYRFNEVYVGAFGEWAPAVDKDCAQLVDCSGYSLAFGADLRYRWGTGRARPWLGLTVGYKLFSLNDQTDPAPAPSIDVRLNKYFLGIDCGLDLFAASSVGIGPYVAGSLDMSISATEGGTSVDPNPKGGLQGSVSAGLRISFLP